MVESGLISCYLVVFKLHTSLYDYFFRLLCYVILNSVYYYRSTYLYSLLSPADHPTSLKSMISSPISHFFFLDLFGLFSSSLFYLFVFFSFYYYFFYVFSAIFFYACFFFLYVFFFYYFSTSPMSSASSCSLLLILLLFLCVFFFYCPLLLILLQHLLFLFLLHLPLFPRSIFI